MSTTTTAEYRSVAEVAARLGLARGTVYGLVHSGTIPAIRIGGSIRIPAGALDRWLADREEEALASVHRD